MECTEEMEVEKEIDYDELMEKYYDLPFEEIQKDYKKWDAIILNFLLTDNNKFRRPMPDFPKDMVHWVNTLKPISQKKDLIGKVVIYDFFTYCCINCDHILPYLKEVEDKFCETSSLAIIGIHTPKFFSEAYLKNVRDALSRSNISHPVLHDPTQYLWKELDLFCWPTLVIVGPQNTILCNLVGEVQARKLCHLMENVMKYVDITSMVLNSDILPTMPLIKDKEFFHFPTYITCCEENILVSDTGNNRLVLMTLQGEILDIIGSRSCGSLDGSYFDASFNSPRGTVFVKPNVYVADTSNHSIRMINLETKTVSTVFVGGDNEKYHIQISNRSEEMQFNFRSPWDICYVPKTDSEPDALYIAVAGSHQIWRTCFSDFKMHEKMYKAFTCVPFAGSGEEECRNNVYLMKSAFAQPSGITYADQTLYIADSESSSIRKISLLDGKTTTVVGASPNPTDLCSFGDCDGVGVEAKLQHPLGVCAVGGNKVYVSDTYNNKIKRIEDQEIITISGWNTMELDKDECCFEEALYFEPTGLCYSEITNMVLVCDTNNHCIKSLDLAANIVKKINVQQHSEDFQDLETTNAIIEQSLISYASADIKEPLKIKPLKVNLKPNGKIHFYFSLDNKKLLYSFPPWNISFKGNINWKLNTKSGDMFEETIQPSLELEALENINSSESEVELKIFIPICDSATNACFSVNNTFNIFVTTTSDGCEYFNYKIIV